jgi:hypothetical protein
MNVGGEMIGREYKIRGKWDIEGKVGGENGNE